MTARPMDAIAVRNIMAADLGPGSIGLQINRGIVTSHLVSETDNPHMRPSIEGLDADEIVDDMVNTLRRHPTYWISRDMQALAVAAAMELPDDYAVEAHEMPSHRGLLVLSSPLASWDIRGRLMRTHAITWHRTGGDRVVFGCWTSKYDEGDELNREMMAAAPPDAWAAFPAYTINVVSAVRLGQPIPHTIGLAGALIPSDADIYTEDGIDLSQAVLRDGAEEGVITAGPDPRVRFMTVVWRLMQQSLARVNQEEAPRPLARQSKRLDLVPLVTVIQLRQIKRVRPGESADVEWSHRWLRRGHWRRQWYKVDGVPVQKAIYIHPTVCGPDDKPLVIKDHVTALVR